MSLTDKLGRVADAAKFIVTHPKEAALMGLIALSVSGCPSSPVQDNNPNENPTAPAPPKKKRKTLEMVFEDHRNEQKNIDVNDQAEYGAFQMQYWFKVAYAIGPAEFKRDQITYMYKDLMRRITFIEYLKGNVAIATMKKTIAVCEANGIPMDRDPALKAAFDSTEDGRRKHDSASDKMRAFYTSVYNQTIKLVNAQEKQRPYQRKAR